MGLEAGARSHKGGHTAVQVRAMGGQEKEKAAVSNGQKVDSTGQVGGGGSKNESEALTEIKAGSGADNSETRSSAVNTLGWKP